MVKPHGIKGELGIRSLTEHPDLRFAPGATLLLGPDEAQLRPAEVERSRPFKNGYLLKLVACTDRDRAEELRGWGLYIPVAEAEPLEEGSYYHHQLIGMRVRDERHGLLGTVVAVVETPAHDLLEIESPAGKSFYLPLVDEFVRGVDTVAGVIETGVPRELTEL